MGNSKSHNELVAECIWYLKKLGFAITRREASIQVEETHIVVDVLVTKPNIGDVPVECGNITSLKSRIGLLLSGYPFIYWYPISGVLLKIEKEFVEEFGCPVPTELKELNCIKCGFKWFPRVENPATCPQCKSTSWSKPRMESGAMRKDGIDLCACKRCGHEWFSRIKHPNNCPRCHSPSWNKER